MFIKLEKGSFNNYVDKIGGGGQKLSVIVHAWGKIIVQAKGGGAKKWESLVQIAVEWSQTGICPSILYLLHCKKMSFSISIRKYT